MVKNKNNTISYDKFTRSRFPKVTTKSPYDAVSWYDPSVVNSRVVYPMPDGRTVLSGTERKRRYDRRVREGANYFRGDLPLELSTWLMDRRLKEDNRLTGRSTEPLISAEAGVIPDNLASGI